MRASLEHRLRRIFVRLIRADTGSISILGAVFILIFITLAALTIDVGYFMHVQRRLQDATDNAALAASLDPSRAAAIARASLNDNGFSDAQITALDTGIYSDDPSLATDSRFAVGAPADSVRLSTQFAAPAFFSKSLLGNSTFSLEASATSQNAPIAGFTALPDVASLDAASLASNLSTVVGAPVTLSDSELSALGDASTSISLLDIAGQLADLQGTPNATVETVFSNAIGLATLAQALHDALSNSAASPLSTTQLTALNALGRIAQTAGNNATVNTGDLVASAVHDTRTAASLANTGDTSELVAPIDAVLAFYQAASGDEKLSVNKSITVAGSGISVEIISARPSILGSPPRAPIAAAGPVGTSIYSSTTRIKLTAQTLPVTVGIINVSVSVPLIIELGYGQATLSSITCGPDISTTTDMGIAAQSGLVTLYIGNVSDADFEDFTKPLNPGSATLVSVPLLGVTGTSSASLQTSQTTLHFSRADIASGTVKTTGGLSTQQAANNLASGLTFSGALKPVAGPILQPVISTLIQTIVSTLPATLELSGVHLGYMDVTATSVRCGIPALVQ